MPVDPINSNARARRLAAGLSQDELARISGVSRQAIGAIEAGRHRPGVDAAIALAAALNTTVEGLFAATVPSVAPSLAVLPTGVLDGSLVRSSTVGAQPVHAVVGPDDTVEHWPLADGRVRSGLVQGWDPRGGGGLVVIGCDPALGLAGALLPQTGPQRLIAVHGSTHLAIEALRAGRAHGAMVHGPRGALPDAPRGVLRLRVARWRVGLASERAGQLTLTALTGGLEVVQREDGASSQRALIRALDAAGAPHPSGQIAGGHLSAVRGVQDGARAAVTMEPAAIDAGLSFLALEEHEVEIWVAAEHGDHPGFAALAQLLASQRFHARLAAIGGYDLADSGSLLTGTP